jgi:hypothetical protein
MIADALRIEIEAHARRARVGNPMLRLAAAGRVPAAAIERYLASLRYALAHTVPYLTRATERAMATGRPALAAWFSHKRQEEAGHDRWADDDLGVLRSTFVLDADEEPVPAMCELMQYLQRTIDEDCRLYLGYIVWAEYFTVLAGGEVVKHLVERNGVPPAALTCLARHVVLDEAHTDEGFETIDALLDDPAIIPELRRVVRHAMGLFDRACVEMVDAADEARVAS